MWSAVVFDLDGTLADTGTDLVAAANATLEEVGMGRVLDPTKDNQVAMYTGGRAMLRHGFDLVGETVSEAQIEALYPVLVDHYAQNLCVHSYLYPGCAKALHQLGELGVPMAICTNKPGRLAAPLLKQLGITHHFGALIAADSLPVRKPNPEPLWAAIEKVGSTSSTSVLVGDSLTDRKTAGAAGVTSLMVGFGPIGDRVREFKPHGVLNHFDELCETLSRLFHERQQ